MIRKLIPVLGFVFITAIFFWQVLLKSLIPTPADTIVGLYYPYRDLYFDTNPNGLPFKNFLITDPVRQQYPWRSLAVDSYKTLNLPTWNPYSFSGTPSLANFQSAAFYPFNIVFFIFSLHVSWSILIMLQPLLAGIFLYLYLRNLRLDDYSSFLGGVIFAFSGFFAMWLEWGTVLQAALWLPLILLSIDKIGENYSKRKNLVMWTLVLIFSTAFSFFAGHLQTFLYLIVFSVIYFLARLLQSRNRVRLGLIIFLSWTASLIISLPQLVPTFKFILLSGRAEDQLLWQKEGWFIPVHHLVQFIAPDFFGNPATLNYWGTWNYGELTGFVGVVGLVLFIYAVLFRRDKKTYFFGLAAAISLFFAISNPASKTPFILGIPFISTAQPTRLLFITDFSLSVLAALGLNFFILKGRFRQIVWPLMIVGIVLVALLLYLEFGVSSSSNFINYLIAKRNLYFPAIVFAACSFILILYPLVKKKFKNYFILLLIFLVIVELFRFSWKFNTFSKKEYLYPETPVTRFLQQNTGYFRFATNDPRILAPNFSIMHKLSSAEGYDPLYVERYAKYISAINRDRPDINPPFGFNRIVRIENFSSNLVDLLGVKYVLSISDLNTLGFRKVFEYGQTKVYENDEVLPRTFFVKNVQYAKNEKQVITMMFDKNYAPLYQAIVEENVPGNFSVGDAEISEYTQNEVVIQTNNNFQGFLILTDTYYPTWHVKINGKEKKIIRSDFNFRGVVVPPGKNMVVFRNYLL
jgi:hypothetical protein